MVVQVYQVEQFGDFQAADDHNVCVDQWIRLKVADEKVFSLNPSTTKLPLLCL